MQVLCADMEKTVVAILPKSEAVVKVDPIVELLRCSDLGFLNGALRSCFFFLLISHIRQNKDQV